jgi:hypothetical protein
MATKISIANQALLRVGAKRISSFSEGTAEANAINDVYDDIRDEFLSEAQWTFAQKRATLATIVGTPLTVNDEMSVIYAKPADFIKLNYISDSSATVKVEGDRILSNTAGLKILYTYRNDDPSTYYPMSQRALVARLAAEICFALTESATKTEALVKDYEGIALPKAVSSDAQQGTPIQPIQDEWLNARFMGGNAMVAPPGSQTWHPVW